MISCLDTLFIMLSLRSQQEHSSKFLDFIIRHLYLEINGFIEHLFLHRDGVLIILNEIRRICFMKHKERLSVLYDLLFSVLAIVAVYFAIYDMTTGCSAIQRDIDFAINTIFIAD